MIEPIEPIEVGGKKVTFASQERMAAVEHLAPRFFSEVIRTEYTSCVITDDSDLGDFGVDASLVEEMLDRFEDEYYFDARKIGSTRIVDLLELLDQEGVEE